MHSVGFLLPLEGGGGNERTTTIIKTVVLDSKTETEQYTTTN